MRKIGKVINWIGIIIFGLLSLLFLGMVVSPTPDIAEDINSYKVLLAINLVFTAILVFTLIMFSRKPTHKNEKAAETASDYVEEPRVAKAENNSRVLLRLKLVHLSGLPIPEGVPCKARSYRDRIEFISGTTNISLSRNKITDVRVMKADEIQKQSVSSVGGAVMGAVLLGPIGAVIGGRAKQKKIHNKTHCLLVTYYDKDNNMATIAFDAEKDVSQAKCLASVFKRLNKNQGFKIEL